MSDGKTVVWKNGVRQLVESAEPAAEAVAEAVAPVEAKTTIWKKADEEAAATPPANLQTQHDSPALPSDEAPKQEAPRRSQPPPRAQNTLQGHPAPLASQAPPAATRILNVDALKVSSTALRAPDAAAKDVPVAVAARAETPSTRVKALAGPSTPAPADAAAAAIAPSGAKSRPPTNRRKLMLRAAIGVFLFFIALMLLQKPKQPAPPPTAQSAARPTNPPPRKAWEQTAAGELPGATEARTVLPRRDEPIEAAPVANAVRGESDRLEQAAVNALASGDRAAAFRYYTRLAQVRPDVPAYALAASILEKR